MNKPTFRQSYDKIVDAYMSNTLEPYNSCACFIGNMLNNNMGWTCLREISSINVDGSVLNPSLTEHTKRYGVVIRASTDLMLVHVPKAILLGYTPEEIVALENNFLGVLHKLDYRKARTEEALFEAMQSTLSLLKQIHEDAGEVITADPSEDFTKRPEPCA